MNFGGTIRLNKLGLCLVIALIFLFVLYFADRKNPEKKSIVSLKTLLIASIETAIKGGKEIVDVHKNANLNQRSKGKTKEGANEPITIADERSNCAMFYSLTHTFGNIKVYSEEKSSESDCRTLQTLELDKTVLKNSQLGDEEVFASEVTIWIDPLDATQEFTENLLQYVTTMVCIAVRGEPVIGVIHFPFQEDQRTIWAWVGRGTSENIKNKQSKKLDENNLSVIISRSHSGKVKDIVTNSFGHNVKIFEAGGAGYKSLEVASRNVNAYIHITDIKKWDVCAGNAILNALGGKMTSLNNKNIDFGSSDIVITGGILATMENHNTFIEKLKNLNTF